MRLPYFDDKIGTLEFTFELALLWIMKEKMALTFLCHFYSKNVLCNAEVLVGYFTGVLPSILEKCSVDS